MLLSVIMPNYNHGAFLESRLTSILNQLDQDSELVIVDDASTDNSVAIIEKIATFDKRVHLLKNSKNLGVNKTVNIALNASKGKYIAPLGADDVILDGFIKKTMQALIEYPEIPICCSNPARFYSEFPDKIDASSFLEWRQKVYVFNPNEFVKLCRSTGFNIPGSTCIIKREDFLSFGAYNDKLGPLSDWYLNHSIALSKGIIYIPETLALFRITHINFSSLDKKQKKTVYPKLFELLLENNQRSLRNLFKQSTLLKIFIRHLFPKILFQINQLDIIFYMLLYYPSYFLTKVNRAIARKNIYSTLRE